MGREDQLHICNSEWCGVAYGSMSIQIRDGVESDLPRINEIYNRYIVDRHTSFDTEPWTLEDRRRWFEKYRARGRYRIVVLEVDGVVMGFASSSPFRDKAAYDTSVETTIVLAEDVIGRGLGKRLFPRLIEQLEASDIHRAYALIALPNDPSITLHADNGYHKVGTLDEVGHKLGSFHSVLIMERRF